MQIISVAQKMPAWVDAACADYQKRLPRELALKLLNLPLASRRRQGSAESVKQHEAELIEARLAPGSFNLALDERGEQWTSRDWSGQLENWMREFPRVNLIIGGPDGLADSCLALCQRRVALGRMTMPHALVRVVLLEQVYRAWTILQGHPYHRD